LIILQDVLFPEYYSHLALFVKGISLLNTSSISEEDLLLSSLLLNQFVAQFSSLYGSKSMTHNLHLILHLPRYVKLIGPLWSFSCYKFEDINGRLSNFVHGTCHVGLQIPSNLCVITKLPLFVRNLKASALKNYCIRILHKRFRLKIAEKICEGLYCVGPLRCFNLKYIETALEREITESVNVQVYSRLLKDGVLYVSYSYRRGKKVS